MEEKLEGPFTSLVTVTSSPGWRWVSEK